MKTLPQDSSSPPDNLCRPARRGAVRTHIAWIAALGSLASALIPTLAGCNSDQAAAPSTVVIYTSVDQEFAEPLLQEFTKKTGVRVDAVYDTEAGKTSGFLRRIQREAQRPRCDVWWSSEVFGTVELARAGLLDSYDSPAAADIPGAWHDAEQRFTCIAARARVLAYDPRRVAAERLPHSWKELSDSPLLARLALANPLFGTTRGHVGAMFAVWGADAGRDMLKRFRTAGVLVADGNSQAVRLVAAGSADICMTDTDDVWSAQARGESLTPIFLPLDEKHGPVWIPNSVALVRGAPHGEAARRLIDFLLSEATERAMAASASRNVPVRPALRKALGITDEPIPPDYSGAAAALPAAMDAVRELLLN